MPADLDHAKYVSFTSYKKDGLPVSLPVWVVPFEGGYAFTSNANAFKVKRVRRDARASLTVCNFKGSVSDGAQVHTGVAVLLEGADAQRVADTVKKKYRIGYTMLTASSLLKRLIGKDSVIGETAIKVMLSE